MNGGTLFDYLNEVYHLGVKETGILNPKILSSHHKESQNFAILVGQLSSKLPEKLTVVHLIMPLLKSYKEKIMICQLMYGVSAS